MNDFEKIEHLLLSKKFEELSPTEVREVTSYFENATDYNDMRDTLMQVKSTLAADKLLIKPNVELKEKLLLKFESTYTNKVNSTLGKTKPFYKNIIVQWSAAASIVIVISLSIFGYIQNLNNKGGDNMAVNYDSKTKSEKFNLSEPPVGGGENTPGETPEKDENGEGKLRVTTDDDISSNRSEDHFNNPNVVGNSNTVAETEMGEGDVNVPKDANSNLNNTGFFGSYRNDNSTLDTKTNTTLDQDEEKKDNANYYLNTTINKESDKPNDESKVGGMEDQKANEPNKTTNVKAQSILNTTVNYQQNSFDRNYGMKNRKKDKKENNQVNLGLAQEKLLDAEVRDSLKMKTDSLKLDSNYQIDRIKNK